MEDLKKSTEEWFTIHENFTHNDVKKLFMMVAAKGLQGFFYSEEVFVVCKKGTDMNWLFDQLEKQLNCDD